MKDWEPKSETAGLADSLEDPGRSSRNLVDG